MSTDLLVAPWPAAAGSSLGDLGRLRTIRNFFQSCLTLFRAALLEPRLPPLIARLLHDCPANLGEAYHRQLPDAAFTEPLFFRTDESAGGIIFEIQCPGSGWGDLILLRELHDAAGRSANTPDPVTLFADQLERHAPAAAHGVMHLLDNASNPPSMHHFIRATSARVAYWGLAPDLSNSGCGLIRSHSVQGLVAENLFWRRLARCTDGLTQFDLPPLALFDQKLILSLPFAPETYGFFPDSVREAIAYTAQIDPDGFVDSTGERVALDTFTARPPSERRYFFKYAGFDTGTNWGSRGVRFGADPRFPDELRRIKREIATGRPWVVQPDLSATAETNVCHRATPTEPTREIRFLKISRFYGPTAYFGTKIMASASSTVHGQSATAITIGSG